MVLLVILHLALVALAFWAGHSTQADNLGLLFGLLVSVGVVLVLIFLQLGTLPI